MIYVYINCEFFNSILNTYNRQTLKKIDYNC